MTTPTPARALRYLAADWRQAHIGQPDRSRRRISKETADHIAASYPATLGQLVADPDRWTAFPRGYTDAAGPNGFTAAAENWKPDLAIAYLGENTWLYLSSWADSGRLLFHLVLITPCPLHRGYQLRPVHHTKHPADLTFLGTDWESGDDEDLALVLADLDQTACPGDCGSVPRPARDGSRRALR
jgi:hypothetical protein